MDLQRKSLLVYDKDVEIYVQRLNSRGFDPARNGPHECRDSKEAHGNTKWFPIKRAIVLGMNARTILSIAIFFFGVCLKAQQPESVQKPDSAKEPSVTQRLTHTQPPDSAKPWEMAEWLNSGKEQERIERLVSIGVERDVSTEYTHKVNAKWFPLRTGQDQKNAILFLPCVRDNAYVYLMEQQNSIWHVIDFEKPDCHYDMSVFVEIAPIRNPALDEVLVHHVCEGHGTGYSQQDFGIYSVAHGKFKQVLDAEEVILASQYFYPNPAMNEIHQRSLFILVPIENSRSRAIEETQSYQFNNKLTVKRRLFRWNAAKGRYMPSKFVPVVAAPN